MLILLSYGILPALDRISIKSKIELTIVWPTFNERVIVGSSLDKIDWMLEASCCKRPLSTTNRNDALHRKSSTVSVLSFDCMFIA